MSLPRIAPYSLAASTSTNRTEWTVDPARSALLVHDMQNHFVRAFERGADGQIDHAIAATAELLALARAAGVPVVYTAQPPRQEQADRQLLTDFWGPGLETDEAAQIIHELAPLPDEVVLTKWRYSAFYRTDLLERLRNRGRDQLLITGIYAHIGCLTTALEAFMNGIQPFFVQDAQADFSAEEHEMALRYVSTRCGQAITSADVVAALCPSSGRSSERTGTPALVGARE